MGIRKSIEQYTNLPKSMYVLFFARIINALGSFIYVFLTTYLTQNLHLGTQISGYIIAIITVSSVPGMIIGGKLADKVGRKKVLLTFQICATICLILCTIFVKSLFVTVILALFSFFTGAATPATGAMLLDITTPENRKASYSLFYLGNNIGLAIGPALAGLLYAKYFRWIFIGNAAAVMSATLLIYFTIKETIPTDKKIKNMERLANSEKQESGSVIGILFKKKDLLVFAAIAVIYSLVYTQYTFSLPLQMNSIYGASSGTKYYGLLVTINALEVVGLTTIVTIITHKFKAIQNVAYAGVLFAIGFGMITFISSYKFFIISTFIWTLGEILNVTNSNVYIAERTPISHRARFNSIYPIISGSGYVIGPIIMGTFIEYFGIRNVWPVAFFLAALASLMMYGLYKSEKTKRRKL